MKTLILSIGVILAVSGCAQTVDTFCLNYTPITYDSDHDTVETKRQVKEQNAVWSSLCR